MQKTKINLRKAYMNDKILHHPKVNLEEFRILQSLEDIHIGFELTLACPNKCKHCINNSSPEKTNNFMSIDDANLYASQFNDLFKRGIRYISLTGGEPLIAKKQMHILSDAAAAAGIECGVVTSAFWATEEKIVNKIINEFPKIKNWEISVDIYHQEFISIDKIKKAYSGLKNSKKNVFLRMGHHRPLKRNDLELFDLLNEFAEEDDIIYQTIYNMGRGEKLKISKADLEIWDVPCPNLGLIINWDGSTSPCCSILATRRDHPLQFGNAQEKSLVEIHKNFKCHPLRQIIRIIGFKEIINWILEYGKIDKIKNTIEQSTNLCFFCEKIFTDIEISNYLLNRASKKETKLKIALLSAKLINDNKMLCQLINEYKSDYNTENLDFITKILKNSNRVLL